MRRTPALVLVGCLLTMTGCSDDDPAGELPRPSAPTSATPAEPTDAAAPILPPAARTKTAAGAKAFVRYYVEALNHAYASGSSKNLRAHSDRSCTQCEGVADSIDKRTSRGGTQSGGTWTVVEIHPTASESPAKRGFAVRIKQARGEVRASADGQPQAIRARSADFIFTSSWFAGTWRILQIEAP